MAEARIGGRMGRKPNFYIERRVIGAVPIYFYVACEIDRISTYGRIRTVGFRFNG